MEGFVPVLLQTPKPTGTQCLRLTQARSPVCFNSSLEYLYYLIQYKHYVNSCDVYCLGNNDKSKWPVRAQSRRRRVGLLMRRWLNPGVQSPWTPG